MKSKDPEPDRSIRGRALRRPQHIMLGQEALGQTSFRLLFSILLLLNMPRQGEARRKSGGGP